VVVYHAGGIVVVYMIVGAGVYNGVDVGAVVTLFDAVGYGVPVHVMLR